MKDDYPETLQAKQDQIDEKRKAHKTDTTEWLQLNFRGEPNEWGKPDAMYLLIDSRNPGNAWKVTEALVKNGHELVGISETGKCGWNPDKETCEHQKGGCDGE